jgi:hypothetical protein
VIRQFIADARATVHRKAERLRIEAYGRRRLAGLPGMTMRRRASGWRRLRIGDREYQWRAGIRTHEWTIGIRYEFAPDVWLVTFLCLALVIGRRA